MKIFISIFLVLGLGLALGFSLGKVSVNDKVAKCLEKQGCWDTIEKKCFFDRPGEQYCPNSRRN